LYEKKEIGTQTEEVFPEESGEEFAEKSFNHPKKNQKKKNAETNTEENCFDQGENENEKEQKINRIIFEMQTMQKDKELAKNVQSIADIENINKRMERLLKELLPVIFDLNQEITTIEEMHLVLKTALDNIAQLKGEYIGSHLRLKLLMFFLKECKSLEKEKALFSGTV